jgi:hypothetical protein
MKKFLCVAFAATIFGGLSSNGQTTSIGGVVNATPLTVPAGISQLQVDRRLITQNTFGGLLAGDPRITGNFGATARWNSMGNLTAGTTVLNGFRTQTNGRALTSGFKIPSGGVVSNPFIEWIGNSGLLPAVSPGILEFRWAASPTGGASNLMFEMSPPVGLVPGFSYATRGNFVGQKNSGTFGSFTPSDIWSATGLVGVPNFRIYGNRHQFTGYTMSSGLILDGFGRTDAFIDFGNNQPAGTNSCVFKFRSFNDPLTSSSNRNVWQSDTRSANIVMGRQDYFSTNNSSFYMSLFDGPTSAASNTSLSFIRRAGIYACTDGNDEFGNALGSYGAIVGDISGAPMTGTHYGILGIAEGNYGGGSAGGKWAGYFIGDVEITGSLSFVSDRKFKTEIKDEENIMSKIMLLKPKNYLFDIVKNKNMALSNKLQHGLISQEVEEVFPELVQDAFAPGTSANKTEDGKPEAYKGLNYIGFIPMLIKGLQEQQSQIEDLKKQLETVSVNNTLVLTEKNSLNLPAEIENKAFSLSQNTPNPFSEKTTISYSLPTDVSKAILGVFDLNGKMLLQFNLQNGKNQQVQVNGSTLGAGMYIYSIIADGQEVISKRMILTK